MRQLRGSIPLCDCAITFTLVGNVSPGEKVCAVGSNPLEVFSLGDNNGRQM